jgi:hypothetical protein
VWIIAFTSVHLDSLVWTVTRRLVKLEAIPVKDHRFVQHALRDSMQVTVRHIVKSVRLVTPAVEEWNQSVIPGPFLPQVLDTVLLAVVDTSVMVINEWSVLQVPSVMDPSLAVLLVHQEPSVQEKVTRLLSLVMMVSILVVTPLYVKTVQQGGYVRRELKEIVQLGKLVSEVPSLTVLLVTILMVVEVPVNHVRLESTTPRVRHRVRMTVPLVLSTWLLWRMEVPLWVIVDAWKGTIGIQPALPV